MTPIFLSPSLSARPAEKRSDFAKAVDRFFPQKHVFVRGAEHRQGEFPSRVRAYQLCSFDIYFSLLHFDDSLSYFFDQIGVGQQFLWALEKGKVQTRQLISEVLSLWKWKVAFQKYEKHQGMKIVLLPPVERGKIVLRYLLTLGHAVI